jgi:hypothetical protein
MAVVNYTTALRTPVKLCASPTDLSTAFPHGGTALGLAARVKIKPQALLSPITAEEFGGTVIDHIYCGEKTLVSCVLRGWDADAISTVFPNSTVGTVRGKRYIRWEPGTSGQNKPGYRLSSKAVKLFFSPESVNYGPGLLVYEALPAWDEAAEISMTDDDEAVLPVAFWAVPAATTGRAYEYGFARDLNIT